LQSAELAYLQEVSLDDSQGYVTPISLIVAQSGWDLRYLPQPEESGYNNQEE